MSEPRSLDPWQLGMTPPATVMFETPELGVAVVDPPEPAPADPPVVAEPSWDDPAFLDIVDRRAGDLAQGLLEQRLGPLEQLLQQAFQQPAPQQQGPDGLEGLVDEFGNLNVQALVGLLGTQQQQTLQAIDQRLQSLAEPLHARQQQETITEGNQRLQDILADDIARHGDFPADPETGKSSAKDLVEPLARLIFPDVAERYGQTPRAAELAMSQASSLVRGVVAEAGKAALAAEQNRIAALSGARVEPGAALSGVETLSDKPLSAQELAQKYGAKATALTRT